MTPRLTVVHTFFISLLFSAFSTFGQTASIIIDGDTLSNGGAKSLCRNVFIPFDANATGLTGPLTYYWTTQGAVPAAVGIKAPLVKFTSTGQKQVTLSVYGNDTVNVSVTITVLPEVVAPVISSAQTICNSSIPQALTRNNASGSDGNFTYQWQFSNNGISNWQDLNQSDTIFQPTALTTDTWYRVKVNSLCNDVYSNTIKITVRPAVNAGLGTASDNFVCAGSGTTVYANSVSGGTGNYFYQWQTKLPSDTTWQNIANATSTSYFASPIQGHTQFRCRVASCGQADYTSVINIDLNQISIDSIYHPGSNYLCPSVNNSPIYPAVTTNNPTGTIYYRWYRIDPWGNWVYLTTSPTYNAANGYYTSTQYRCIAYHFGCFANRDTSNALWVNQLGGFSGPSTSPDQIVCHGDAPAPITRGNAWGFGYTFDYEWQTSPTSTGPWTSTGNTSDTLIPLAGQNSFWYRVRVVPNRCLDTSYTTPKQIEYAPALQMGQLLPDTSLICYGGQKTISIGQATGGIAPYTYQWQYKPVGALTWINLPGAGPNTTSHVVSNLNQSFMYRVIVSSGCNEADTSNTATVYTAEPLDAGSIVSTTGYFETCMGSNSPILRVSGYKGGIGPYTKVWQKRIGTGSWFNIGSNSDTLIDLMPITQTVSYRVKVIDGGGCGDATSNSVDITIRGLPGSQSTQIEGPNSICKGTEKAYFRLAPIYRDSVHWQSQKGTLVSNGTDRVFVDYASGVTAGYDTVLATLVDPQIGCERLVKFPVNINSNPAPAAGTISLMPGTTTLVYSDSTTGYKFSWGYIERSSGEEYILTNSASKPRFDFVGGIDTTTNIYFVTVDNTVCETRILYENHSRPFDLNEDLHSSAFIIYPNPASGFFKIKGPIDQIMSVNLVAANGQKLSIEFDSVSGEITTQQHLVSGLYVVLIQTRQGFHQQKLQLIK